MDIRAEPHFTIIITLTDDEVKNIILDPDEFLSQLQDSIAPNGDYTKRAAQSDAPRNRKHGPKRAYKGHMSKSLAPKRHCDLCNRDFSAWKFDMHMAAKHPTAGTV